jgi:hypothetical protein
VSAGDRSKYVEVGAAIRQAAARAAEKGITPRECRALLAVVALVSSYSRLTDRVPVRRCSQPSIAEMAALPDKQAGAVLKSLADKGIVVYAPSRGRGRVSLVGLPPDGEIGRYEKGASVGAFSGRKKAPSVNLKGPIRGSEKAPATGTPPEKYSEKTSEKRENELVDDRNAGFVLCGHRRCQGKRLSGSRFCRDHQERVDGEGQGLAA